MLISTIFAFDDSISLEYIGPDTINVNISTNTEISGFQFNIEGATITDASGGSAGDNGFMMSVANNTVIGFTFSSNPIPVGEFILLSLRIDIPVNSSSICFVDECWPTNQDECVFSDPDGQPIEAFIDFFNNGSECIEVESGCLDSDACNFNSDAIYNSDDCIYGTTYYQDADNDGNGNPDITEPFCDPTDGWVSNSDDDDDTCSGTVSETDGSCCLSGIFGACGICDGGGPIENYDCDDNCIAEGDHLDDGLDCAGVCGGDSEEDECNVCNGNNTSMDACDNCGGDCITGNNGTIVCSPQSFNPDNEIIADCNGVCGGEDISCVDCAGNIGGQVEVDCNGVCSGSAYIDSCDSCVGGDTGVSQCLSIYENISHEVSITATYPNPFNPSIHIEYSVASVGYINLQIIGLDGRHINTITNSVQTQGLYNVQWTPNNVPSGMYLIQLKANDQVQNKKIIYLK